jgi:hypothetical protein
MADSQPCKRDDPGIRYPTKARAPLRISQFGYKKEQEQARRTDLNGAGRERDRGARRIQNQREHQHGGGDGFERATDTTSFPANPATSPVIAPASSPQSIYPASTRTVSRQVLGREDRVGAGEPVGY